MILNSTINVLCTVYEHPAFCITLTVFVALLYAYWWHRPHPKFPPGPRGIPLLGAAPFLGRLPSKTIKKWSLEQYGPVMSMRMGLEDLVVLNTYDAVNSAFVKQNAYFSDRPRIELLRKVEEYGIVSKQYNEAFKIQKHFGIRFLREKGLARREMEDIVNEEGDEFVRFLQQFEGKPFDIKKYFYWLTVNVISKVALGKRHDYGDPDFMELFDVLANVLNARDGKKLALIHIFPFLAKLPIFSDARARWEKHLTKILDTLQQYIDEHRDNFDPNNINDFIDAFLYEQKYRKLQNESFTDKQLQAFCLNFFFAGSETTSTMLSWCFVFLLNYPEYHRLIEKEIEASIGTDGIPSKSHKEQMPITFAFIQETMRVKTLTPLGPPHKTSETAELMGYVIPKGTKVLANLDGVHTDPTDWPDPEVFNPRRHIDENGRFVPSKKIIPFSVGSRFCLGESLARVEIFIFFVKLVQRFRVRSAEAGPPPMDQEILSIMLAPKECDVILGTKK